MKLPKSYIQKYGVSKEAWRKYKASLKSAAKKRKKSRKGNPHPKTRKTKRNNPRRNNRVGKRNNNITGQVMKWTRVASLLLPGIGYATMKLSTPEKVRHIGLVYTGWDNREHRFKPEWLLKGWTPYIATSLVTHLVQKMTGIIRRL